ncbi:hypothetical protein G6F71_000942 [Rhizopus microsporus]|nr:hypothetical protein G6F71_000942 [Rhizopus microsporus]KAG1215364.1 hypothetical protein G6F69_001113 [Rhizopus microsporus]KAG1238689.1 hypothetical protein G6F67_000274 [Rhizopus microsporus]KAG1269091.1 hypothetical protein G6F68_000583 [Rhizopus microsporus]
MSPQVPALPPRQLVKVNSSSSYFSPLALFYHLETHQSDHRHVFKSISDKENKNIFACSICHIWLHVTSSSNQNNACSNPDYLCHHYHATAVAYECCGCQYQLQAQYQAPIIPLSLIKQLETTRPKGKSFAQTMQQSEQSPTMSTTFTTILIYVHDLLNGTKKNINTNNPHFLSRIGNTKESLDLLYAIGFKLENEYLVPPDIEPGTASEARLKQIREEILLTIDALRSELGEAAVPSGYAEKDVKVIPANVDTLFGIIPALEQSNVSTNGYLAEAYHYFGLVYGASDQLVSWTYKKLINEVQLDIHTAIDYLTRIANVTKSELLETLVVCEKSTGNIGYNDISDAYAYFNISLDSNVDDKLLIGLYQVKLSDEPEERNMHQDKLRMIAIAKNSTELIEFLKTEKGITSATSIESIQQIMGVPSHMLTAPTSPVPVGLNNIGNTCYFNSLLQYYFTLLPFRQTMMNNEMYIEDENSEPKKIGGIEVDQLEIKRAKRFVELLKTLFVNLQYTSERAISPEYDLAYMALLNERDQQGDDTNSTDTDKEAITKDTEEVEYEATDNASLSSTPADAPPSYDEVVNKTDVIMEEKTPTKPKERPSVDAMMFGKQQDVTECMGNVMYLVEAALKPISKTEDGEQVDDMIRQLFYGKARQIISYCDDTTLKVIKKEMEEDFSHVIVDASEGKDLYDGLDEYFFENQLESFQGGHEATRQVSVKSFPPVLQILVQRVQFDRATANVYKSNAYIQFDKTIYLDRYMDDNFERLKDKRTEVAKWRREYEAYKQQIGKYKKFKTCQLPVPDLLEATYKILEEFKSEWSTEERDKYEIALQLLEKEAKETKKIIEEGTEKMKSIKSDIRNQYKDYKQIEYKLHAVFIHQGQANYGHYWIYILDHQQNQWWKYNDSLVTKGQQRIHIS